MAKSSSQLKEQIELLIMTRPSNEAAREIQSLLKSAVREAKTGMLRKCIDLVGEDYEDETQRVSLPAEVVATLKKPGYNPTHESIPVKGAAIRNQYRLSLRDALFQLEEALEEGGE